MELRQLEHFVTVAEERNFTRAAQRVHIVQSGLSASIAALEREVGTELFTRSSRRVDLTEAGHALLPAARRALGAAADGRAAVDAVRGLLRGRLTVGVIQSFGAVDLPALFGRFHEQFPAIELRLRHDSVPTLVRATASGDLDLAFVDRPFDESRVRSLDLGTEALVLAVARDDRLAGRRSARLASLGNREFVEYRIDSALRSRIDTACADAGLERTLSCEVDNIGALVDLVAAGLGVALLPPDALLRNDRVVPVATRPAITRELAAVVAADHDPSPAARALLDLLAESRRRRRVVGASPG